MTNNEQQAQLCRQRAALIKKQVEFKAAHGHEQSTLRRQIADLGDLIIALEKLIAQEVAGGAKR